MMKSRPELVVSVACCHMAFTTEAQSRMADLSIFMVHDRSEKAEQKTESKTESSGIKSNKCTTINKHFVLASKNDQLHDTVSFC